MIRKDIKISVRKIIWQKAIQKAKTEFHYVHTNTDALNVILLLKLYKFSDKQRDDNSYLAYSSVEEMNSDTKTTFTIEVIGELLNLELLTLNGNYSKT